MRGLNRRTSVTVVGSGPGGAVTACVLAEGGREVLLIEEGEGGSEPAPFSLEEMATRYRCGGVTVAVGSPSIAYAEGRCWGGGSEVNSGLYHRTPPEVLERWNHEYQVAGLTEAELRTHFETCERDLGLGPARPEAPASIRLERGARALGWKSLEVPRLFDRTAGTRTSMARTYLPRARAAGAQILTGTRVARIHARGDGWELEAHRAEGGCERIGTDHLFLACGAIQTPALLRRSGIRTHVGDSLRLHPTVRAVARFEEDMTPAPASFAGHQIKEFSPRLSLGCSVSTPPQLALGLLELPDPTAELDLPLNRHSLFYAMVSGAGRGSVRVIPGFLDPLVRYRLEDDDLASLADGLRKLAQVLLEAGASAVFPVLRDAKPICSTADLQSLPEQLARDRARIISIHLFSTCPMGEDRARCAVDSFGRVHRHPSLRVADASLLCDSPSVNPQGTIMAIARRNALEFLGRL